MEENSNNKLAVNLTLTKKLVYEVPPEEWISIIPDNGEFAKIPLKAPMGIAGYKIVVFQKVGENKPGKFISCLDQGEMLSDNDIVQYCVSVKSEGFFNRFRKKEARLNVIAYAVNTDSETEEVVEQFSIRPYEITVKVWIKYKITDAIKIANSLFRDPLRKLCEEVVNVLNEKIPQHDYKTLTESSIKGYVESIGKINDLGIQILQASAKFQLPEELEKHMRERIKTMISGENRYSEEVINIMINDMHEHRSIIMPAIKKYIDKYTDGELDINEFKDLICTIPEMSSLKQYFEVQNPEEIISVFKKITNGKISDSILPSNEFERKNQVEQIEQEIHDADKN